MKNCLQTCKVANVNKSVRLEQVHATSSHGGMSLLLFVLLLALAPKALASSTWYVDGVHGSNKNDCKAPQTACKTIGHAISLASSGDSIMVAPATYTENLTIGISLNVIGSGAKTTIVDGGQVSTVFTISKGANVKLLKLTIRNGFADYGGGVCNDGTLTISNSTISNNTARSGGGGIANVCIQTSGSMRISNSTISGNRTAGDGGGIENYGTMSIEKSTISRNTGGRILFSAGGGIANSATMSINNSTISANSEVHRGRGLGGGIENTQGTLTINNSTISANTGGINNNSGTSTLQNSIVANNVGQNCSNFMTSNGYNLSSDGSCSFNSTGDLNNTDPKLGQLRNNGGPTQTQALLSGSPAIDAGNPSGCTDGAGHLLKTDQRGKPRPDKEDTGGCDMGAYERQKD